MLEDLFARDYRLPLNRKEVFYAATVLPAIICSDGLVGFIRILGKSNIAVDMHPNTTNIQIFSEYDLRDAIRGDQAASEAWKSLCNKLTGDTPDIVILVDRIVPLLLVLEAKLFDRSVKEIAEQIRRQQANVAVLKQVLPAFEVVSVALVPQSAAAAVQAAPLNDAAFTVITWEQIAAAYDAVPAAAYWVRLLRLALSREQNLYSKATGGPTHEHGRMTAAAILDAYDRPNCVIRSVGVLGQNWRLLKQDIAYNGGGGRKWAINHADVLPSQTYLGIHDFVKVARLASGADIV